MRTLHRFCWVAASLATTAFCAGCGEGAVDSSAESTNNVTQGVAEGNGREINGREINGREMNGREMNGREMNGREINGKTLSGIEFSGNKIKAVNKSHKHLSDEDLIGAQFDGKLIDGTPFSLRLDDVDVEPSPLGSGEVNLYTFSDLRPDGTWGPLCGTLNGAPVKSMILGGRWNYAEGVPGGGSKINDNDAVTFACAGFALYKCAELGYEPWRKYKGTNLGNHHQACTRMLRADYCGNGTPHTENGVLINVYDKLGIQSDTDPWTFEAEWAPQGARCVGHQRLQGAQYAPNCGFPISAQSCGSPVHWNSGTLIASEH